METVLVERFRTHRLLRSLLSVIVAATLMLVVPVLPASTLRSLPASLGQGQSRAADMCSAWAAIPTYSGAYAYTSGSVSCDGARRYSFLVCLRKDRSGQPDEDTSCSATSTIYYSGSNSVSQCGAHGLYRGVTYWYPTDIHSLPGSKSESGWANMNANC
jgi:hypothetical protein